MVEGARSGSPSVSGERASARPRSSRCAAASARAARAAGDDLAGQQPQPRRRRRARPSARTAAACPGRRPSTGTPAARARATISSSSPARAARAIAAGNAPTPGTTSAVGRAQRRRGRRSAARARRRARAPSRRCAGCPCRSRRSRPSPRHAVSVPLVEGTPVSVGSIATAARSARANALNAASIMWCAFVPGLDRHVQRQPGAARRPRGRTPRSARGRSRR